MTKSSQENNFVATAKPTTRKKFVARRRDTKESRRRLKLWERTPNETKELLPLKLNTTPRLYYNKTFLQIPDLQSLRYTQH